MFRAGPAETLAREDWEACQAMLSGAFFCAQAATRSSAFSMFSIEFATLKRK